MDTSLQTSANTPAEGQLELDFADPEAAFIEDEDFILRRAAEIAARHPRAARWPERTHA